MSKLNSQRNTRLLGLGSLLGLAFCCQGADWPQYRGPNHDGVATDHINPQWSGAVTTPLWLVPVRNSLCGFVVSGGRAFTQTRRTVDSVDSEVCVALSIASGAELWATAVDNANYPDGGVGYDDGPRTTPSLDSGSVFVLTSYLKLYRLNATNGAVIWQRDLLALYGGTLIRYQNAASPLIEGGLIYLNANCGSSTLMALRTSDGSVAWRSQNATMTQSTPVLATLQGVRQVIFATGSGLVSLDPLTGAKLWGCNYPFTYNPLYALAVSPVVHQDMVFMTGTRSVGYGSFVRRVTLTNNVWTTTQLWSKSDPSSTFTTAVARDGFLYGTFGYDNPQNECKCVNMRTGAVSWSQAGFGRSGLLMVDDYLMALTEKCELVLAQVNPNAYVQVGRFTAFPAYSADNNKCWNVPAIADGKVYLRSTSYGAAYNFSLLKPSLTLDAPWPSPGNQFELTVRTANGTPMDSNRLAGMEVRASTNLALSASAWPKLTNNLLLTNGVGRVLNVEGRPSRQYFIVRELE